MIHFAFPVSQAQFSLWVLGALLLVLMLSVAMFVALARAWTSGRYRLALSDWARARGFTRSPPGAPAPAPLDEIPNVQLRVRLGMQNERTIIAAVEAPPEHAQQRRWHVLVHDLETSLRPAGLRPANAITSLIDLYALSSYSSMIQSDRFSLVGADWPGARVIATGPLPTLVPPDVGLLLHGRHLVLDFSARPFDTIEFDRMIALASEIVAHL